MNKERRATPRLQIYVEVRWESQLSQHQGTISDIGPRGCFILTQGEVRIGELVIVEIDLPAGEPLTVMGTVVNHAPEIGFGVNFEEQSVLDEEIIADLREHQLSTHRR